ncbi:hypothetical protein ACFV9W_36905 [Streptomyces sp. NPDC059897]|uniref:hypothetical protein n=1 Tax=Streptomyces sp. NPDC059897 TaxID=3346994 RepID=UPI00365512A1
MDTTFDVRVWQIERGSGKLRESYGVRWSVGGKRHHKTFQTFALADGFRAELVAATHAGEPFNMSTGLPDRHEPKASSVGWYDFAVQFTDAQWPRVSSNHRKNTARTLMIVTTALMDRDPPGVPSRRVRTALSEWAFNTGRRDEAPDDVAAVLGWVRRHTPTMDVWTDPLAVEDVLLVVGTLLDGRQAAASSEKRHRRVLRLLMKYAIVRGILLADPVPESRNLTQRSASAIDRRRLLNERQAAQRAKTASILRHVVLHGAAPGRSGRAACLGPCPACLGSRAVGRHRGPHRRARDRAHVDRQWNPARSATSESQSRG